MVATFDNTLPTPKDRMRAAVGDRDVPANALRQDEEYEAVWVQQGGDERLATAVVAEGLAAEYAQRVDAFAESGGISVRWGERVKTWLALAAGLREALAASATGAGAGMVTAVLVRPPEGGWDSEYVRACPLPAWGGGRTWWSEGP